MAAGAEYVLDANGNVLIGADGKPLIRNADGADAAGSTTPSMRGKRIRQVETVPAGQLLTLRRLRVWDVPDVDLRGKEGNVSDPYLILSALDDAHEHVVDETRTPHVDNVRKHEWEGSYRLFLPDDEAASARSKPIGLRITLMDRNAKKADQLIGDVTIQLTPGAGRRKVEIPSRSVSPLRPFVAFRYEAPPRMFYEHVEWGRLADQLSAPSAESDAHGDVEGPGEENEEEQL